jgi:hypothetical protein
MMLNASSASYAVTHIHGMEKAGNAGLFVYACIRAETSALGGILNFFPCLLHILAGTSDGVTASEHRNREQ